MSSIAVPEKDSEALPEPIVTPEAIAAIPPVKFPKRCHPQNPRPLRILQKLLTLRSGVGGKGAMTDRRSPLAGY
uniref:Uncharacterized protein n=1 Tax=Desertifilum tharense IPPAS B-1220 TaxID=1781255 RepID=A0ACD5GUR6_9CYAN